MSEPTLTEYMRPDRDVMIYKLEVPRVWLMTRKYPRLSLVWWILKMAWKVKK